MANDPKYVRLADRLTNSGVFDLNSGWSITGFDVKEFPEDNEVAATFVRSNINSGRLEGASKAEYDEVVESNEALLEAVSSSTTATVEVSTGPIHEGDLRELAGRGTAKLLDKRDAEAEEAQRLFEAESELQEAQARIDALEAQLEGATASAADETKAKRARKKARQQAEVRETPPEEGEPAETD